jgi:hypothetical protein
VKQENQSQKTSGIFKSNSAAAGIFLNIVLIMLTAIIVFLTYSLILNIQTAAEQNDSDNGELQPSKIIQLEVLNGCGKEGIADERIVGGQVAVGAAALVLQQLKQPRHVLFLQVRRLGGVGRADSIHPRLDGGNRR